MWPLLLKFIGEQESLSKSKALFSQFVLENVRNRTKTVLVTLKALNTRNLSKIVML